MIFFLSAQAIPLANTAFLFFLAAKILGKPQKLSVNCQGGHEPYLDPHSISLYAHYRMIAFFRICNSLGVQHIPTAHSACQNRVRGLRAGRVTCPPSTPWHVL